MSASVVDNVVSCCFWTLHDGVGTKLRRVGWCLGWVRRCALVGGRAAESVGRRYAVWTVPQALLVAKHPRVGRHRGPRAFSGV